MKKICCVSIALLSCIWGWAQTYIPGEIYFGTNQYVEYRAGDLPIIISAPHGGYEEPGTIPNRNCPNCVLVRDSRTLELAREMDTAIYNLFGQHAHVIICRLARTKLDANREIVEAAQGNPDAELAWNEYHGYIESARDSIEARYGKGIYIDLHGHGHDNQRLEYGYLLTGNDLRNSDQVLDTDPTFVNKTSIKELVSDNLGNRSFSDLLRGPASLGAFYEKYGYPGVPAPSDPAPLVGEPYFSGGYSTRRYGSRDSSTMTGIQLECNYENVRDRNDHIQAFAKATSCAVKSYLETHLFPGTTGPTTVTNLMDSGPGSLREAIGNAVDGDTIQFVSILPGDTIKITQDRGLCICQDLTIEGPGPQDLTLSGEGNSRIFEIANRQKVEMFGLGFIRGMAGSNGDGGAIQNDGLLSLTNCRFESNVAGDDGGAIAVSDSGTLRIEQSWFSLNESGDDGGAIFMLGDSTEIRNSTFLDNEAGDLGGGFYNLDGYAYVDASTFMENQAGFGGAGIRNFEGRLRVINSTFYKNSAIVEGGGILGASRVDIDHCTFSENEGIEHGGGVRMTADTAFISNSILARNVSMDEAEVSTRGFGRIFSWGHNLIRDTSESLIRPGPGDILGGRFSPVEGGLLPIADNGGHTQTMGLEATSLAIDRAMSSLPVDQRGFARPSGSAPDMGAFEYEQSVGIDGFPEAIQYTVFPNPFSHTLYLEFLVTPNIPYEISLFDLTGRPVQSWQLKPGETKKILSVDPALPEGVYVLRIEGDQTMNRKILIKK